MFVVTVDIWPHGRRHAKYPVVKIAAANDGTGTSTRGNYLAWDVSDCEDDAAIWTRVTERYNHPEARVPDFPRRNDQAHLAALTCAVVHALGLDEIAVSAT